MKKRNIVILVGAGLLIILWAAFRPEKLFLNQKVNEGLPTASAAGMASEGNAEAPATLFAGQFHSGVHETSGTATILQLRDGKKILRLTNFKTSNGPDVHVYLVAASDVTDNDTVKKVGFLQLGPIKGNEGDQNYDLPVDADLTKYRAATIWCERFSVNFGTAPLTQSATGGSVATLLSGQFHSGVHETSGTAAILRLADGEEILRLTNFKTSNGPDVHVYLIAANDAKDNETVKKAGFVQLGSLKGNEGDQNYEVPSGTDLAKYRAVTIWCERFNVNFGTAPLVQQ